jgi:hypothetical protein
MRHHFAFILLTAIGICGCSRLPSTFTEPVSRADRIVVTSCVLGSELLITGDEARRAAEALCSGHYLGTPPCSRECEVEFFKGTNRLAEVAMCHDIYLVEGVWYQDRSGIIAAWYKRLQFDESAHVAWVNDIGQQVLRRLEFAGLQTWAQEVLSRYSTNALTYDEVPWQEIPDWLGVVCPVSHVYVLRETTGRANRILVEYPMFCGLLVGPTNDTSLEAGYITNVMPGVYAFWDLHK